MCNSERMAEMYRSGKSTHEIARSMGVTQSRARYAIEAHGIALRSRSEAKRISLIGERYGRLAVIREAAVGSRSSWICRCDCGSEAEVTTGNLRSGKTQSCGCLRAEIRRASKWKGVGEIGRTYLNQLRRGASLRSIEFLVTDEDLWLLYLQQGRRCQLSGIAIHFLPPGGGRTKRQSQTASLDRIDSSVGYVAGNVQWVHEDVNKMKQAFDQEYFIELCRRVVEAVQ